MSKRHLLALCALALLVVAAPAHADDAASSTPPLSIQETASSTPPAPTPPPAPDPIDITLVIETPDTTLFAGPLTVSACAPSAGSAGEVVGYCALEQSGIAPAWSWWGDDAFLDSLGGVQNDNAGGVYWMWFANLEMGAVALNKHTLAEGESLLVTLGKMPLRLDFEEQPVVGSTSTIVILAFAFDENYNPVWLPAANARVQVGSQSFVADASGEVLYIASTTDSLESYASKDGFVPTGRSTITPIAPAPVPAPAQTAPNSGSSGQKKRTTSTAEALSFLLAQQRSDGSFGSAMMSDWAALALAAAGAPRDAKDALGDFLVSAKKPASLTDYERHAMALLALGINPHEANVIQKIVAGFDGTQMGDPDMLNDDIFALLPLLHAGYDADDTIIKKVAAYIVSNQEQDGSWRYQDITSAAMQALTPFSGLIDGVSAAIVRATTYLKNLQEEDGCMGNVYSHSWAMQALGSRNDAASMDCLLDLQQEDGGFEPAQADAQNRIWATSYALSALSDKSWNEVLKSFRKPKEKEGAPKAPSPGISEGGLVLGAATLAEPLAATTTVPLLAYIAPAASSLEAPAAATTQTIVPKKTALEAPVSAPTEQEKAQAPTEPTVPHKPIVGFLLSLWQRLASLLWLI